MQVGSLAGARGGCGGGGGGGGGQRTAARALVAEARAGLLPLALGAPQLALVHAVHLAALLVVGARSPAGTARGTASRGQPHVFLHKKI